MIRTYYGWVMDDGTYDEDDILINFYTTPDGKDPNSEVEEPIECILSRKKDFDGIKPYWGQNIKLTITLEEIPKCTEKPKTP